MDTKFIDAVFDLSKIPTKVFLVIAIMGSIIFYFPSILPFQLDKKSTTYLVVSLIYLVSIGMLVCNFVIWILTKIKRWWNKREYINKLKKSINTLDVSEKSVLREFYLVKLNTVELKFDDPAVLSLLRKSIIFHSTIVGDGSDFLIDGHYTSFRLNDYLNNEVIEYIDFPQTSEEAKQALNKRPIWAKNNIVLNENLNFNNKG